MRRNKRELASTEIKLRMCLLSFFSCVRLFATLWTVAPQAPLSMGFSRQEHWSGFQCPPLGDLPNSGIETASLALAGGFFTTSTTWEALKLRIGEMYTCKNIYEICKSIQKRVVNILLYNIKNKGK